MNTYVPCRDEQGNPYCPVCMVPVFKVGEFCSVGCYTHFILAVVNQPGIIEMESFLDIESQPWHTQDDAA